VSLYDLQRHEKSPEGRSQPSRQTHSSGLPPPPIVLRQPPRGPIARSMRLSRNIFNAESNAVGSTPTGHASLVRSVQWYDTGAFVSAASDGAVLVWDTSTFTPVAIYRPLQFENAESVAPGPPTNGRPSNSILRSIQARLQPGRASDPFLAACPPPGPALHACEMNQVGSRDLLAVASPHVPSVKILDIRTGGSSHTLCPPSRQGVMAARLATAQRSSGIQCVQWSPASPFVLAAGGVDGSILLFDIRKPGRDCCWATLSQHVESGDDARVRACTTVRPHYEHWIPKHRRSGSRTDEKHHDNTQQGVAHEGPVSGLAWSSEGRFLVSGEYKSLSQTAFSYLPLKLSYTRLDCVLVAGGDGILILWDLWRTGSQASVPRRFLCAPPTPSPGLDALTRSNLTTAVVDPGAAHAPILITDHGYHPAISESVSHDMNRNQTVMTFSRGPTIWIGNRARLLGYSLLDGGRFPRRWYLNIGLVGLSCFLSLISQSGQNLPGRGASLCVPWPFESNPCHSSCTW
jgi:WD domain, G-beta repeat